LNLAVGGNWPGNPDGSTHFPQNFVIDYVRVYEIDWSAKAKEEEDVFLQ
jgi:beta-glucanase (GH16 family)